MSRVSCSALDDLPAGPRQASQEFWSESFRSRIAGLIFKRHMFIPMTGRYGDDHASPDISKGLRQGTGFSPSRQRSCGTCEFRQGCHSMSDLRNQMTPESIEQLPGQSAGLWNLSKFGQPTPHFLAAWCRVQHLGRSLRSGCWPNVGDMLYRSGASRHGQRNMGMTREELTSAGASPELASKLVRELRQRHGWSDPTWNPMAVVAFLRFSAPWPGC